MMMMLVNCELCGSSYKVHRNMIHDVNLCFGCCTEGALTRAGITALLRRIEILESCLISRRDRTSGFVVCPRCAEDNLAHWNLVDGKVKPIKCENCNCPIEHE